MISKHIIQKNYQEIQNKIRSLNKNVILIAASKTQPIEAILSIYELGHRDFGENYVQELAEKATLLNSKGITDIRWHLIGHLQTNKINMALPHIHVLHSVDSVKLVAKLNDRLKTLRKKLQIFIELNLSQEKNKTGASEIELPAIIEEIKKFNSIETLGLMTIPDLSLKENELKTIFHQLRLLESNFRPFSQGMLSMGMSQDYELAIQAGATHVRVGTAIFGERLKK